MIFDLDTSTVTIAGRRFPAAALVCPLAPGQEDRGQQDRLLGGRGYHSEDTYIPLENGALVEVCASIDERDGPHKGLIMLSLRSRHCYVSNHIDDDGPLYLPEVLRLIGRRLVPGWEIRQWCEPEWVAEYIQRISTYEVIDPYEGPLVRLVHLSEMDRLESVMHEERSRG